MVVLYLNRDRIGDGDPQLGKKLLQVFLDTLLQSDIPIDRILCLNSAVFLTTEGSPVLDLMRDFMERGTEISSCGTCLDFYGRKQALRVGGIGTMGETVATLTAAARIISPC